MNCIELNGFEILHHKDSSLLKGAKGTGSFARKGLDLKSNGRV